MYLERAQPLINDKFYSWFKFTYELWFILNLCFNNAEQKKKKQNEVFIIDMNT